MPDKQDALNRAFSLLSAQLDALGEYRYSHVDESWVRDYHAAVDILEAAGFDVAVFRIDAADVTPLVEEENYMTRSRRLSKKRHMDRYRFLAKLRGIVSYFEIADVQPPKVLGFRPPPPQV